MRGYGREGVVSVVWVKSCVVMVVVVLERCLCVVCVGGGGEGYVFAVTWECYGCAFVCACVVF